MGQGKGHDNAEQNKLRRMAWRALSNLPVFWKCRILICLWYLNLITGYNWIEGKLPKTGKPKGWIWGVEQGRGFCRGVLRLVEWTKWKSEDIVKCSLRHETDDERLNEWMNLPQALDLTALIVCFIFTAPLKGWRGNVVFNAERSCWRWHPGAVGCAAFKYNALIRRSETQREGA